MEILNGWHRLHSLILIIVSYFRPHQHTIQSEKLVWNNFAEAIQSKGWRGIGSYKFLVALLFITMIILYIKFG